MRAQKRIRNGTERWKGFGAEAHAGAHVWAGGGKRAEICYTHTHGNTNTLTRRGVYRKVSRAATVVQHSSVSFCSSRCVNYEHLGQRPPFKREPPHMPSHKVTRYFSASNEEINRTCLGNTIPALK